MRDLTVSGRLCEYCAPGTCGFDFGIGEAALASSVLAAPAVEGTALATTALAPAALAAVPAVAAPAAAAASTGLFGTGIGLSELGTIASIGGTLLQVKGGLDNAAYQSAVARAEAAALKQKANEDAAAGQRVQGTRERQTALVQSRARALAAASGTDAASPDIINNEGQIARQGEYNALSALYEGQSKAAADNYQADIDLFRAKRIEAGAPLAAGGTLLSGISSIANSRLRRNYLLDSTLGA
jgi:hypothetical protein